MESRDQGQTRAQCRPKNPCVLLRNLVDLMQHPISQNATARHLEMLKDFLNASHYAFWLRDIPYIIRLYEVIIKRLEAVPGFREPLECLLHFSAVPPMLTKFSDMVEYARDLQEYFSILGYLILCLHDDENLSKLVLNAIIHLLEPEPPVGYCCVPLENIKEAADKSNLAETLAQLLHVIDDNLYPLLLDATLLICEISKTACEKMVPENAIEYLLQRLEPTWRERNFETKPNVPSATSTIPNIEIICCILWKLLSVVDSVKQNAETPSKFALWSLQYAFRWSTMSKMYLLDRNNLLAIILKLLDTFPDLEFVESELADDIAILARHSKSYICSIANSQPTDGYLNFQFRKIIFACLHYFKQFNANKAIQQNRVVKYFTKFLYKEQSHTKDCKLQYDELIQYVVKLIPKYLEDSVDSFLSFNGPENIIAKIEHIATHGSHETEVLEAFLYCLHKILYPCNDSIIVTIGELGTSSFIAGICNKILMVPRLTQVHQKCIAHCFCIMQILATAKFINDKITCDLCIRFLKRVIHPNESDSILDPRLIICAIDFLWENVVFTSQVCKEFLQKGGIYLLLDVMENNSYPVKSISLGVIADISKMSHSLPYLMTWRKLGLKLIPMLLEIFRGAKKIQCDSYNEASFSSNAINNAWVALCQGQKRTFPSCCATRDEILRSCRCRIHGILHSLKIRYKDKVEFINQYYRIYYEKLDADNEITMLFAENFLSLSMCETWLQLNKELKLEGITPIDSDNDYLTDKIQHIRQWRKYLRSKIEDIIKKETHHDDSQERESYALLNEARLSDALDALNELRFLSSCTEKMFQMTKKFRLTQDTDVTNRIKITNYHLTHLPFAVCKVSGCFTSDNEPNGVCDATINTHPLEIAVFWWLHQKSLNIHNQTVNIQSNVIHATDEEPFDISAVSLGDNESLFLQDSEDNLSEQILKC